MPMILGLFGAVVAGVSFIACVAIVDIGAPVTSGRVPLMAAARDPPLYEGNRLGAARSEEDLSLVRVVLPSSRSACESVLSSSFRSDSTSGVSSLRALRPSALATIAYCASLDCCTVPDCLRRKSPSGEVSSVSQEQVPAEWMFVSIAMPSR